MDFLDFVQFFFTIKRHHFHAMFSGILDVRCLFPCVGINDTIWVDADGFSQKLQLALVIEKKSISVKVTLDM